LGQVDDHDGIAMAIDEFIEKKKLKGEKQQRALMLKLGLYGADKLEAAVKFLSEIIDIESDSDTANEAVEIRMRVKDFIAGEQTSSGTLNQKQSSQAP
ncbi:MAG: hypothetical protein KDN22_30405, partial [Verrucomicrobiae bacterium]|nr:hypothetical protein [Verrucomicrobiae bacterium]